MFMLFAWLPSHEAIILFKGPLTLKGTGSVFEWLLIANKSPQWASVSQRNATETWNSFKSTSESQWGWSVSVLLREAYGWQPLSSRDHFQAPTFSFLPLSLSLSLSRRLTPGDLFITPLTLPFSVSRACNLWTNHLFGPPATGLLHKSEPPYARSERARKERKKER